MSDNFTLQWLTQRLRYAVDAENYEEAARLRDRIAEVRTKAEPATDKAPPKSSVPGAPVVFMGHPGMFENWNKPAPPFFNPEKLRPALDAMGQAAMEQARLRYEEYYRQNREALLRALDEQMQHYFGLALDPYTMKGQVIRLIDHRNATEEYIFRGRLLLVVDTTSLPWAIARM